MANPDLNLKDQPDYDLRKMDEEQNMLLQKMIERQERDIILSRITAFAECALLIGLLIVFLLLVPKFINMLTKVEQEMEHVDSLIEDVEESLIQITALAVDADEVVKENDEAIAEALENFNKVDFDSLNESISSIADIIAPVVDFVNVLRN